LIFRKSIASNERRFQGIRKRSRRRLLVEQLESRRFLTTIDLVALVAGQGTSLFGADAGDQSGISVSNAGDVNGDGFDDLIIGAYLADASGNLKDGAGDSYVIFGAASLPTTIDLANLGSAGINIFGADAGDRSGTSVSSAGDVNGDGFDDLIIGAYRAAASGNAKANAGESYVIFGAALLPATIDVSNLDTAGITIFGAETLDNSGVSVSSAGDVNGDGFDDLLIGAFLASASGNARSGAGDSYVIFGAASLSAMIDLNTLGSAGITIFGAEASDRSGRSVSSAGDVNGDGFDDLIIGAYLADASGNAKSTAGESYVIFGATLLPTMIDLAMAGSAGITLFGADVGDRSGFSVTSAGDVNGDGFDDLLIGARLADSSGNTKPEAGESYVIFGAASLPATIDLGTLGQSGQPVGITFFGVDANDRSSGSVSSAGDVNGDGFDDLIIGAYRADGSGNTKSNAGESYVIFGAESLPITIDLANLGSAGITILGADANDQSGISVSSAGDVNGDGFDDLIIGARNADASGNLNDGAGESYVIFGGNGFTNSIAAGYLGTNTTNTINGTAGAQILNGADGDDTLVGLGGADVLLGGRGNDNFEVTDLSFRRIVGGNGKDTLKINGAGLVVDLTTNVQNRIVNIERIDITGTGNNELNFNPTGLLALSTSSNTLQIKHDLGDTIRPGTNWKAQGLQKIDGIYVHVITQDTTVTPNQARLEIDNTLPYQNPLDRYDVDRNGSVNPFDVLVVINDLNRNGVRTLTLPQSENETPSTTFYVDVDGLGDANPFDVLQVINYLNRSSGGEGESKASNNPMDSDVGSRSVTQTSHAVPPISSISVNDRYFETFDVHDLEQRRRPKVAPR
jgi:Dockerin type I domain/FG-GAP repeat/RTX calcium-binding nonapeptide repeat (4 copies)